MDQLTILEQFIIYSTIIILIMILEFLFIGGL